MNDKPFTPRKPRPVASSRPVQYFCYGRACGLRKSTAIKAAICILKKIIHIESMVSLLYGTKQPKQGD